jgi:hypothetical protein
MNRGMFGRVALLASVISVHSVMACHPAKRRATPAPARLPVTFSLTIDGAQFAVGERIVVSVADPTMGGYNCGKTYGITQDSGAAIAPGGCQQPPDTRETVIVTPLELVRPLVIPSHFVVVGTSYEITMQGRAADGCNVVTALIRGVATAAQTPLMVATTVTERPCPAPPS